MLSQQHLLVNSILCKPDEKRVYQTHMCGLCHALGDDYGLASRLITSHEMILLNMLVSSQSHNDIEIVERRCPLNPLKKVSINRGLASKYAAAVAIQLAAIGAEDHIKDSKGQEIRARVLSKYLEGRRQAAIQTLMELGLDCKELTQLGEMQTVAEQDETRDPSTPSAIVSARLFAMTSHLANKEENEKSLIKMGTAYGEFLYLLDAFRDFANDITHCDYNPLRRFSHQDSGVLTLSRQGIEWLLARFENLKNEMQRSFAELNLHRYQDVVSELLYKPLDLSHAAFAELAVDPSGLTYKQLSPRDVFQIATFSRSPNISDNRDTTKRNSTGRKLLYGMGIAGFILGIFADSPCEECADTPSDCAYDSSRCMECWN
jgi:hypothetical protein